MARTVDEAAYALRRDEFLDAAQRLLEVKGYEQMSVQDVLAETGASKGAFYHYFGSKHVLLEAVIERMSGAVAGHLAGQADNPDLSARERLSWLLAALAGWKAQRRDLLVALLRVWCSDDNAVVRPKLRASIADRIAPMLADIVRQGMGENVFSTAHPDQCSRVIVSLIQDLNDRLADLFLAFELDASDEDLLEVEHTVAAYTDALERILGLPSGEVVLVDMAVLRRWFAPGTRQDGVS